MGTNGQIGARRDPVEVEEAVLSDRLRADPRHLASLLAMAVLKTRAGDDRAALSFYKTALAVATQPGARVAPDLVPALRTGEAFIGAAQTRFAAHLSDALADAGLADGRGGARLRRGIDLLFGRGELFQQQPSMFYFPELPQRQFFERDEFAWTASVEAQTAPIRAELEALMTRADGFAPYVGGSPDRPRPANPLLDDSSWSAAYLWQQGTPVAAQAEHCPAAMRALAAAPMPRIDRRSPTALFSLLRPGTHIRPHHGLLNTRLICHLPLIAPPGCGLRVGNETREWREGELTIFDDSFEHEAWNRGSETRVVLLFEIWRPELTAEERAALTRIFEAIDAYGGGGTDQG